MRLLFLLLIIVSASAQAQTVTRLEYYFDADPGQGNGENIPITAAIDLTRDFSVPLNAVSEGIHNFYLRAKSSTGVWSIPVYKPVFVQYGAQTASVSNIDKLEYYIDSDPGFGNGITIPVSSAINLIHNFSIPLSGIIEGFHIIYFRAGNESGRWSQPLAKPVFIQSNSQSGVSSPLKRIEYFLDTDPGLGNGTMISISASTVDQSILIDLSAVSPGFHSLYIRSQDINEKWSLPVLKTFFVEKSGSDIVALEYYFVEGTTKTPVRIYTSFTPGKDLAIDFSAVLDGLLPSTSYDVHIVAINADGQRSKEVVHTFVTPAIICDPISPPIVNGASRCGAGSVDLVATGAGTNQSYQWYDSATDDEVIAGVNGNIFTTPQLNSTTTYYVSILNGTCESARVSVNATILNQPTQPTLTSNEPINAGVVSICLKPITLTAPAGFSTYTWSTGQSTQQITTLQPGNFSVVVTDANGCSSIPSAVVQVINSNTCANKAPQINTNQLQTIVGGKVSVNLNNLISDPDDNLDPNSLQIINNATQNGGKVTLSNFTMEVDYTSVPFSGQDRVTIRICDLLNACMEATFEIDVAGDIVVYNGISPNNDTKNDTWIIEYITLFPDTQQNKVTIYNRWGDLVWEGKNYDNDNVVFSGLNKNGAELITGTYFYKIEFTSERKTITGYLSLKR